MQYLCSQCRREVKTGDRMCENCGNVFDTVKPFDPNGNSVFWPPAAAQEPKFWAAWTFLPNSPAKLAACGGLVLIIIGFNIFQHLRYQATEGRIQPGAAVAAPMPIQPPQAAPSAVPTAPAAPAPMVLRADPQYTPPPIADSAQDAPPPNSELADAQQMAYITMSNMGCNPSQVDQMAQQLVNLGINSVDSYKLMKSLGENTNDVDVNDSFPSLYGAAVYAHGNATTTNAIFETLAKYNAQLPGIWSAGHVCAQRGQTQPCEMAIIIKCMLVVNDDRVMNPAPDLRDALQKIEVGANR